MRQSVERACALLKTASAVGRKEDAIAGAIELLQRSLELDPSSEPNAEEDLRRQKEHLQQKLGAAQLELRCRDDFLAVVAHELRNPIAPLSLAIDMLLTEAEQGRIPSNDVLLRRFQIFHRQLERLMGDLNRLLDFTRIRSGRLDLTLEKVDLTEIVAGVLTEMKPQFDRNQCELRLSSPRPEWGCWDSMRLRQIVWNLISNATKFGAGTPVEVAVNGDEKSVWLSVRDHGPGIAKEEQSRIFERFERADARRRQTGFGVGLWLVKRIVDALRGTIYVESEPGRGATFTVTLPRDHDG